MELGAEAIAEREQEKSKESNIRHVINIYISPSNDFRISSALLLISKAR